jgi:hypothetical protein
LSDIGTRPLNKVPVLGRRFERIQMTAHSRTAPRAASTSSRGSPGPVFEPLRVLFKTHRARVLSPDSPAWCSAQSACIGVSPARQAGQPRPAPPAPVSFETHS